MTIAARSEEDSLSPTVRYQLSFSRILNILFGVTGISYYQGDYNCMKQQHLPFFQSPTGDRPFLAMGLLLAGVFTLALQDATVKLIAPETSFWQFQTIRAIGNALFIVMLAMISGGYSLLVPQNWRPVYFRAVMLSICMFCFFSGAP